MLIDQVVEEGPMFIKVLYGGEVYYSWGYVLGILGFQILLQGSYVFKHSFVLCNYAMVHLQYNA